jgi:hypothetical protein
MISLKIFVSFLIISSVITFEKSDAIVVLIGRTTACDTCDGMETNSLRNIVCCAKFSKCCIPDSFNQYSAQIRSKGGGSRGGSRGGRSSRTRTTTPRKRTTKTTTTTTLSPINL